MDSRYTNTRQSMATGSRRLTVAVNTPGLSTTGLAEELEKTEQSITLVLQEIDKNFTQANRIINESILPGIDKYTQESRRLWNNVGFWKEFLESSAQVTLSTYEEIAAPLENLSIHEETIDYQASINQGGGDFRDDLTPEHQSTPLKGDVTPRSRIKRSPSKIPILTDPGKSPYRSPIRLSTEGGYDGGSIRRSLSRPVTGKTLRPGLPSSSKSHSHPHLDIPYDDSTFNIENSILTDSPIVTHGKTPKRQLNDSQSKIPNSVLRHQVLNKNWRVQITPKPMNKSSFNASPSTMKKNGSHRSSFLQHLLDEDSSMSDIVVPPKLQSDLFSPIAMKSSGLTPKQNEKITSNRSTTGYTQSSAAVSTFPSTNYSKIDPTTTLSSTISSTPPQLTSLLTKIPNSNINSINNNIPTIASTPANRKVSSHFYDDSDSDMDHIMDGMSPPVTRQFAVPPTNQLIKTPARQVAQTIVNDILKTVGGTDEGESMLSQESFFDHSFTTHGNVIGDSDSDSDRMDFSL